MLMLVCSLPQAKLAPADGAACCLSPPHPFPVLQAQHVLSGRLPAADYQSKILCCTDWRRKGAAYDLAPLGNQMPSSVTPEFRPLPKSVLQAAFTLQPGSAALSEVRLLASAGLRHAAGGVCVVLQPLLLGFAAAAGSSSWLLLPSYFSAKQADKGDLLPTNLGGFGPSATGGSAGTATAGGGLATAGSVGAPTTKIKLKVGGKKEKKVGRPMCLDACIQLLSGGEAFVFGVPGHAAWPLLSFRCCKAAADVWLLHPAADCSGGERARSRLGEGVAAQSSLVAAYSPTQRFDAFLTLYSVLFVP